MRGLKLLGTAALAANSRSLTQKSSGLSKVLDPMSTTDDAVFDRRKVLHQFLAVGAVAVAVPKYAFGLDMDAFMNSELEKDKANCNPKNDPKCAPKLSADEAMCKYGQSGEARGEACQRVKKAGGALPGATKERSLGGAYAI